MTSTLSWKDKLPQSVMAGLWATALYAIVWNILSVFVDPLFFFRVPNFFVHYWAVFPGAVILSFVVLSLAGGSRWRAALAGGLLAPLNVSFSVLLIILAWGLGGALGLTEPWKYGFGGLLGEWLRQQTSFLLIGAPIAVPCGLVMGWWLGKPVESRLDI